MGGTKPEKVGTPARKGGTWQRVTCRAARDASREMRVRLPGHTHHPAAGNCSWKTGDLGSRGGAWIRGPTGLVVLGGHCVPAAGLDHGCPPRKQPLART